MTLSHPARLMAGITLVTVPTIIYGGLTALSVVTSSAHGLSAARDLALSPLQTTLFRAGHAHAGVLVILSLVLQVLIDAAELSTAARWLARITAPVSAILLSGGFFGIAFAPAFGALLWAGASCLAVSVVVTGVGLLRAPRQRPS